MALPTQLRLNCSRYVSLLEPTHDSVLTSDIIGVCFVELLSELWVTIQIIQCISFCSSVNCRRQCCYTSYLPHLIVEGNSALTSSSSFLILSYVSAFRGTC